MAVENRHELNLVRVRKMLKDLLITEADAARIAQMSPNTVKALLAKRGSEHSLLKLERALEMEKRRRDVLISGGGEPKDIPKGFEDQLALALSVSQTLSNVLHEMIRSAPPIEDPIGKRDAIRLERNLKMAQASLNVLLG